MIFLKKNLKLCLRSFSAKNSNVLKQIFFMRSNKKGTVKMSYIYADLIIKTLCDIFVCIYEILVTMGSNSFQCKSWQVAMQTARKKQ